MTKTQTKFRRPLRLEEVPLPGDGQMGFTLGLLEPSNRAEMKKAHLDKVRYYKMERIAAHDRCRKDPAFKRAYLEKCKRSCSYFINMNAMTYDDRTGKVVPFILFDMQELKIVHQYERMCDVQFPARATVGIAKSRAIGFTCVSMACRVWRWMFHDNWSILIGGENRDDVDDGGQNASQQSLFGKIRFTIDYLPDFVQDTMLGPLYKKEENNKRLFLRNPLKPLNIMNGKQMGAMFGRGRRYAEVFADEVAYCEEMENADVSLKQTTNRFFFGSTPKGKANFFYQVMHGGLALVKVYIWWAENPFCDLDWYNLQREHMNDDSVAQELDISFERSAGSPVLLDITLAGHFVETAVYDEALPLTICMDPGFADNFACIWVQWDPLNGEGRVIDSVCTKRRSVDWIVPFILGVIPTSTYRGDPWPHEYNEVEKEIIERHRPWVETQGGGGSLDVIGDNAGNAKTVAQGRSAYDELDQYGIFVQGIKVPDDKLALEHLNIMMRFIKFSDYLLDQHNGPKEDSPSMGEVVTQWRYPKKKQGAIMAPSRPVHDVYCHLGDCLKMWAWELQIPEATEMPAQAGHVIRNQSSGTIEPDSMDAAGPWRQ